jgi:hypothetical protein
MSISISISAQAFILSHCVGNASGTSEAIQMAERRTLSPMSAHARQISISVPVNANLVDQHRSTTTTSTAIQPNLHHNLCETIGAGNSLQKKLLAADQQTSSLVKRTSECQMTSTNSVGDEIRRRSSVSTDCNTTDRVNRKTSNTMNSSASTTIHSTKDTHLTSYAQMNRSMITYSSHGHSSEKVVVIDTTAVICSFLLFI